MARDCLAEGDEGEEKGEDDEVRSGGGKEGFRMITVRYPDGRTESRTFALVSGDNPIGSARPIPDDATLEITDGCIMITAGKEGERSTMIWPWDRITELDLGPIAAETTILREDGTEEDIPF